MDRYLCGHFSLASLAGIGFPTKQQSESTLDRLGFFRPDGTKDTISASSSERLDSSISDGTGDSGSATFSDLRLLPMAAEKAKGAEMKGERERDGERKKRWGHR